MGIEQDPFAPRHQIKAGAAPSHMPSDFVAIPIIFYNLIGHYKGKN